MQCAGNGTDGCLRSSAWVARSGQATARYTSPDQHSMLQTGHDRDGLCPLTMLHRNTHWLTDAAAAVLTSMCRAEVPSTRPQKWAAQRANRGPLPIAVLPGRFSTRRAFRVEPHLENSVVEIRVVGDQVRRVEPQRQLGPARSAECSDRRRTRHLGCQKLSLDPLHNARPILRAGRLSRFVAHS